jgi:uncharacterized protein YsxB (DUF464 family)
MIKAVIYAAERPERARPDRVCGFKTENHGGDVVCAAVSVLCQNTVNSLEGLTGCRLEYRYEADGGYLECVLPGILAEDEQPEEWLKSELLLQSLVLGLKGVQKAYGSGRLGLGIKTEYVKTDYTLFPEEIPAISKSKTGSKKEINKESKKETPPKAAIEFKR